MRNHLSAKESIIVKWDVVTAKIMITVEEDSSTSKLLNLISRTTHWLVAYNCC